LDTVGPVGLERGINVLLFKVVHEGGSWACCARLVDDVGRPAQGIRVKLTPSAAPRIAPAQCRKPANRVERTGQYIRWTWPSRPTRSPFGGIGSGPTDKPRQISAS
jgi:hypothetical protein